VPLSRKPESYGPYRHRKAGTNDFHYAWVVAAVTFVILVVAGGIRGSSGILVVPLESEFHWSRTTISLGVAANITCYGMIGPFAGALMETLGLRRTVVLALVSITAAVLLTATMRHSWQLVALWGIVGAGTGMTANVLAATVATRWFASRRGLVLGLLTSAAAAGQLVFLPLFAVLTANHGWRWMTLAIAGAAIGLLPAVLLWMRDKPSDLGLARYGECQVQAPAVKSTAKSAVLVAFGALRQAMRSKNFWILGGTLFICGASTNGLVGTHLIPACVDHGITEVAGAGLLAGIAIFNFLGATASGWLSDRVDARVLLLAYYGLRGLSLLYMPFAFDSFYELSMVSVFYGLDWTATIPPTIRLTTDAFGAERAGVMVGWLMAIHQLGGAAAAFAAGALRMDLGSYLAAFVASGALCLLAAGFILTFSKRDEAIAAATA